MKSYRLLLSYAVLVAALMTPAQAQEPSPQVRAIAVRPFFRHSGELGPDLAGPVVNQSVEAPAGGVQAVREYLVVVTLAAAPDQDFSGAAGPARTLDLDVTESGRPRPWLRARALTLGSASPSGEIAVPMLVTMRPCRPVTLAARLRGGAQFTRTVDFVCQN